MPKRIGLLTGGGHISSFHAGMLGVCAEAEKLGYEVIGFRDGYKGTVSDRWTPLTAAMIEPDKGGSLLGSSRKKADPEAVKAVIRSHDLAALIVMGGNDHLGEAAGLAKQGLPVFGWPKTMDNDLSKTYFTLGYPTAAMRGAQFVREAHADAVTGSRVHLVTLFGRNTDWVVAAAGVWGAADVIIPAEKFVKGVDETRYTTEFLFDRIAAAMAANKARFGRPFAVVAVAEGAKIEGLASHLNPDEFDEHGNPKIEPMKLAITLKAALIHLGKAKHGEDYQFPIAIDSASYFLRNGAPIDLDRRLAEEAGRVCVRAVHQGQLGTSAFIRRDGAKLTVDLAPLAEVSPQRFMRPENLFDYEAMAPLPAFAEYYAPAFGRPPAKEAVLYKTMPR